VRHALLVLALVALGMPVAATGDLASKHKTPRTVLAIESSAVGSQLVRVDAQSLKPVSKSVWLGGSASAWALSPDGRRLAVALVGDFVIRIIDASRLSHLAAIRSRDRYTSVLAWPAARRLVWLGADRVFVADPVTRKRLSTAMLPGAFIMAVQRVGNTLALLAAPTGEIGPARLALVGAGGRLRSVSLAGIRAGTVFDAESNEGKEWRPGLAFAPDGRVFVVGAGDDPIAEVDLRTLAVTYHRPEARRSLLAKLHDWLEPRADAKMGLPGSSRSALWLGDGRLAVWGSDTVRSGPEKVETTPTGLSIIDTQDWTIESVDVRAERVAFAAGTLLTTTEGAGLTGYSTDGRRRFRVFDGESVWVAATFGSKVYVLPRRGRMRVVDAATGRVVGTRRAVPWILHKDFSWQ
jgi:hypothetical protein